MPKEGDKIVNNAKTEGNAQTADADKAGTVSSGTKKDDSTGKEKSSAIAAKIKINIIKSAKPAESEAKEAGTAPAAMEKEPKEKAKTAAKKTKIKTKVIVIDEEADDAFTDPAPIPAPEPELPKAAPTAPAAAPDDQGMKAGDAAGLKASDKVSVLETIAAVSSGAADDSDTATDVLAGEKKDGSDFYSKIKAIEKESEAKDPKDNEAVKGAAATVVSGSVQKEPAMHPARNSLNLYKRIAIGFFGIVLILLGIVFATSFTKARIVIIPSKEKINNNFIMDVYSPVSKKKDENNQGSSLTGAVGRLLIQDEKTYPATGEKASNEKVAGKVTIYNNYMKTQPLVATTRLLSPEGKLFRIKDSVNVPAGGSVDAEIYADEPKADMEIGPTRFTIPGLWAGLQDKIYAESKEKTNYIKDVAHFLRKEDIDSAISDMKANISKKAESELGIKLKDYGKYLYKTDDNAIVTATAAKEGDETESFRLSIEAPVDFIAFKPEDSRALIEKKLQESITASRGVEAFDDSSVIYSFNTCNPVEGTASVGVSYEANLSLKNATSIDKKKLRGLSSGQLDSYMKSLPEVASYQVTFFPSFIKRTPALVDRIDVVVRK